MQTDRPGRHKHPLRPQDVQEGRCEGSSEEAGIRPRGSHYNRVSRQYLRSKKSWAYSSKLIALKDFFSEIFCVVSNRVFRTFCDSWRESRNWETTRNFRLSSLVRSLCLTVFVIEKLPCAYIFSVIIWTYFPRVSTSHESRAESHPGHAVGDAACIAQQKSSRGTAIEAVEFDFSFRLFSSSKLHFCGRIFFENYSVILSFEFIGKRSELFSLSMERGSDERKMVAEWQRMSFLRLFYPMAWHWRNN